MEIADKHKKVQLRTSSSSLSFPGFLEVFKVCPLDCNNVSAFYWEVLTKPVDICLNKLWTVIGTKFDV